MQVYDNATIVVAEIVGFTQMVSKLSPTSVMGMLNAMYIRFDKAAETNNVYKVIIYHVITYVCVHIPHYMQNITFGGLFHSRSVKKQDICSQRPQN